MWVLTRTNQPELVNLEAFRRVVVQQAAEGTYHLVATEATSTQSNGSRTAASRTTSIVLGEYASPEEALDALKQIARYLGEDDELADLVGWTTEEAESDEDEEDESAVSEAASI